MRNASITARELFEQQQEKLGLRWLAGQKGENRGIESGDTNARRPSLTGYLNAVYPNKVQILGSEELSYSIRWTRGCAGRRSRRSSSSARWRW